MSWARVRGQATGVGKLMSELKSIRSHNAESSMKKRYDSIKFEVDDFHTKKNVVREVCTSFFNVVDVDDSGEISVMEFMNALKVVGGKLGEKFLHPHSMSLFASLDKDQGGSIDLEELISGIVEKKDCLFVEICSAVKLSLDIHALGEADIFEDRKDDSWHQHEDNLEKKANVEKKANKISKILEDYASLEALLEQKTKEIMDLKKEVQNLKSHAGKVGEANQSNEETLQEKSHTIRILESTIQKLVNTIKEKDLTIQKLKAKNLRDRNSAARERKLRRDSLAYGAQYHNSDHQEHILELSQKVAVLTARESHAVTEAEKYKALTTNLEQEVVRLGGDLKKVNETVLSEREKQHDHKATSIRILERKLMTQDEKIFTLEKELACATGQSTSDDHKDSASEKGSSNSEESKLLNRLKDQN